MQSRRIWILLFRLLRYRFSIRLCEFFVLLPGAVRDVWVREVRRVGFRARLGGEARGERAGEEMVEGLLASGLVASLVGMSQKGFWSKEKASVSLREEKSEIGEGSSKTGGLEVVERFMVSRSLRPDEQSMGLYSVILVSEVFSFDREETYGRARDSRAMYRMWQSRALCHRTLRPSCLQEIGQKAGLGNVSNWERSRMHNWVRSKGRVPERPCCRW
jgi:hypothetical protein